MAEYLKRVAAAGQSQKLSLSSSILTRLTLRMLWMSFRRPHVPSASLSLYYVDPVDSASINSLLSAIPSFCRVSEADYYILTTDVSLNNIIYAAKRALLNISPGLNGLPYAIWHLVFQHSAFQRTSVFCRPPGCFAFQCHGSPPTRPCSPRKET